MNVIELEGLSKRYGRRRAVHQLSLRVPGEQVFGLLGRNGAGKSTTIKMMLSLIGADAGSVRLMGHDLHREHNRALEKVGALVERAEFYNYLSGRQNLELLARCHSADFRTKAESLAERMSIANRLDDKVSTYSQGMRQKLGIILSLLPDSKLVVLDEPTNGLDPHGIREVRCFLQELASSGEVTIFLSSHLLSEVEQVCTHLAVIEMGETIAAGPLEALLEQEREILVRVDRPEAVREFLSRQEGCRVSEVSGQDTVRVASARLSPAELNRELVLAGFQVNEFRPVRHTLEEYFLNLTGPALDSQHTN